MPETATHPLIDASHDCESCRAQSSEFYDLTGRCLTCGQPFIVRSRKGDKPPLSVKCPNCEVSEYSWKSPAALRAKASPEPAFEPLTIAVYDRLSELLRFRARYRKQPNWSHWMDLARENDTELRALLRLVRVAKGRRPLRPLRGPADAYREAGLGAMTESELRYAHGDR